MIAESGNHKPARQGCCLDDEMQVKVRQSEPLKTGWSGAFQQCFELARKGNPCFSTGTCNNFLIRLYLYSVFFAFISFGADSGLLYSIFLICCCFFPVFGCRLVLLSSSCSFCPLKMPDFITAVGRANVSSHVW